MAEQVTRTVRRVPTVVTFHGSDLLGERLSGIVRRIVSGYGIRASWKAARRASGIVAVSQKLSHSLPADVDRCKVRVIPNGIDLDRFKPLDRNKCCQNLGWNPDEFHVLFATSGNPVKRPSLARAAVNVLNRLGVVARMHEMRGVPNDQVPIWINASNVLLITSLHEGSPTIVKECLGCNLPVVSVDVGDISERLAGIQGCYLAFPEAEDLASKLRLVSRESGRVAGRARMEALSVERTAVELHQFYREVIEPPINLS